MSRKNSFLLGTLFCFMLSGVALAQDFGPMAGPGGPDPAQAPGRDGGFGGPPPMQRTFHDDHFGRWWDNPQMAQQLNLTDQQKKQMDDIFLQHRLKLIDLNASLEKQETLLHPMIEADQPDETKILAQIDAVAQARAELEKANARMLFDIRKTLTPEQWQKLKTMREEHRGKMMRGGPGRPGGPGGPGGPNGQMWRQHRKSPPPDGSAPPPPPQGQPQPQPPSSEQ
jgi:Spy/CpxP family protein refolding chaperone